MNVILIEVLSIHSVARDFDETGRCYEFFKATASQALRVHP